MDSRKLGRFLTDGDTRLRCAFNRVRVVMGNDKLLRTCTKEEVIKDTEILCNDYVEDRLIRSGLQLKRRKLGQLETVNEKEKSNNNSGSFDTAGTKAKSKVYQSKSFDRTDPRAPKHDVEAVSRVLLYVGEILELRHTSTYTDVLSQLSLATLSEFQLKRAFNTVAREIFAAGISWAKIVSLFAFAGGLSVDCVLNGSGILVAKIKGWTVAFVSSELADWIRARGGWADFVDHFVVGRSISFDFGAWLFLLALLVVVILLFGVVLFHMPNYFQTADGTHKSETYGSTWTKKN